MSSSEGWLAKGLGEALANTFMVGGAAAIVTVTASLFLVYGTRLSGRQGPQVLLPITTIGYAAPGAVLALGLLIPLAAFDNALADGILGITGWDPGLLLTGGVVALVYAYSVRFFAIGQGAGGRGRRACRAEPAHGGQDSRPVRRRHASQGLFAADPGIGGHGAPAGIRGFGEGTPGDAPASAVQFRHPCDAGARAGFA